MASDPVKNPDPPAWPTGGGDEPATVRRDEQDGKAFAEAIKDCAAQVSPPNPPAAPPAPAAEAGTPAAPDEVSAEDLLAQKEKDELNSEAWRPHRATHLWPADLSDFGVEEELPEKPKTIH